MGGALGHPFVHAAPMHSVKGEHNPWHVGHFSNNQIKQPLDIAFGAGRTT